MKTYMSTKKIIIITSSIIIFLILVFLIIGIIISNRNRSIKEQGVEVVIYQYHVYNYKFDTSIPRKEVYRAVFTNDLVYDETIYALDNSDEYNHVIIKDGVIKIDDSNCRGHNCQRTQLKLEEGSIFLLDNMLDISCYPHGLFIVLEEIK